MRLLANRKLELLSEISCFRALNNFGKFCLRMAIGRGIEAAAIANIAEKTCIVQLLIDRLETSIWLEAPRRLIWRLHGLSINILFGYKVSL